MLDLEVHAAHTTHTAATRRHTGAALVFLRHFGHYRFGGNQKRRDGGSVLHRDANHLGRVDDALLDEVAVFAGLRVEPVVVLISFSRILPTTTEPSSPALITIWRAGQDSALRTISTPVFWSSFLVRRPLRCSEARSRATPPPGTMPSSTAARVACIASTTSVAPPTRITATPPASLASRSCSFSRSHPPTQFATR